MSDLIAPNIIYFQTQKQLTALNNIRELLKSVLIYLRACNFYLGIVLPHINYETTSSRQVNLIKHFYKTNRFRKYSITKSVVEVWNKIPNI